MIKSLTSLKSSGKIHTVTWKTVLDLSGGNQYDIGNYYRIINSGAGKKLKEILNGLIPGLIPEPAPVRVPVRRPEQTGKRR